MKNTDEPGQFTYSSYLLDFYAAHKIPVFRSMDYTPHAEARKELDNNGSLCALFRLIAI